MSELCSKCNKFIELNQSIKSKIKLLRENHQKIISEMKKMEEEIIVLKKQITDLKDSLNQN
tara:strand:+ start:279 stop:461 length:183 start_codon:yes stop_codon:yes gene_type:complete